METKYKIKKKINNRGYFAEVDIKVETQVGGTDVEIIFDCECGRYNEALIFGIKYFYEYYTRAGHYNKIKVTITNFQWMPVDTTFIAATFVIINALSAALKIDIERLQLNENTGDYNFPNP